MSNVELIQGLYEAFGRGDIESVLDRLHPDIEWVEPELEALPYSGTHRGFESVVNDVLGLMPQTWETVELGPEVWIDGGDIVGVVGTYNARGKGGRDGSWRFAHVWNLSGGKVIRVESFFDTLAVLRTLGGAP
jgi:uncharacterized protein